MFGFKLSWKMVLVGLLVLGVALMIDGAYRYVTRLQTKTIELAAEVTKKAGELNMARFERNVAEARADDLYRAQEELARRLDQFNTERAKAQDIIQRQQQMLAELDLTKEISNDAKTARTRLNARARDLNRLLEQSSRF